MYIYIFFNLLWVYAGLISVRFISQIKARLFDILDNNASDHFGALFYFIFRELGVINQALIIEISICKLIYSGSDKCIMNMKFPA